MVKFERTKNAKRNIVFGVLLKIYQIVVPFLMRTAMIYFLGVQYLGLSSLFTSVLQVLNLAELGVGTAMVYSMYKPIAINDKYQICALMKLYKVYYRAIGLVIGVVGLCLIPFIPKLVSGDVPSDVNIYIIYLINLMATVVTYWLFAYKNAILQAHQRTDVISKVTMITNTVQYIIQFVVLILWENYYYYIIVLLLTQILNNIIVAHYADVNYPQYKPLGEVSDDEKNCINMRIKDLFTSKIGSIIYDSSDSIVISSFLGLTVLAVYQNYFYILNAVTGVIAVIYISCIAGIGNSIVTETKQKNYNDLKKFTLIICWIAGMCSACLLCLYQPFMELWVGKELMLEFPAVICFVIYFFIRQVNALLNLYKDAAGMWHEDRFRPLIASLVNLVLNLWLIQYIGIYGVILSTVMAILVVGEPWLLYNLFTVIFNRDDLLSYIRLLFKYIFAVIIGCFISYVFCSFIHINLIMELIVRFLICCIVTNSIFYLFFKNSKEFREILILVNNMTRGRLKI